MTGEDHDTDALIAALSSPALPSECVGEDAMVTAMLDALPAVPARPVARRSRRSIAVASVTIASLGVGGLVAAGPGAFFSPAADRTPATEPSPPVPDPTPPRPGTGTTLDRHAGDPIPTATSTTVAAAVVRSPIEVRRDRSGETADECDGDGTHGDAVSDVARSSVPADQVRDVARSACGKPDTTDRPTPADTAPGRPDDTPADTAPGRPDSTPADTAPGRPDDAPADAGAPDGIAGRG